MYALIEKLKIERTEKMYDGIYRLKPIHHWHILATYQDERIANEQIRVWSDVLHWHNRDNLAVKEVPGYIESGEVLSLYMQLKIKEDLFKFHPNQGNFNKYNPSNRIRDDSITLKFEKDGKKLICENHYTIEPDGDIINIYYGKDQDNRAIVARVDGYPKTKAVMRAKREVQYLVDEPDEKDHRIGIARYPIITPEGIVMSWVNRPEISLAECGMLASTEAVA